MQASWDVWLFTDKHSGIASFEKKKKQKTESSRHPVITSLSSSLDFSSLHAVT